jgi:hypothetical protein
MIHTLDLGYGAFGYVIALLFCVEHHVKGDLGFRCALSKGTYNLIYF